MANRRNLWLVMLVMGAACVEPDSGGGHGSTGEGEWLTSDTGFSPPADRSYFIAESTEYPDDRCGKASDVNDTTTTLRNALAADGWTGIRRENGDTQSVDFIDPLKLSFGRDHSAGDSALLSVYAGHGDIDYLGWGTQEDHTPGADTDELCGAKISEHVRLGRMSGGWARVVLLMTSCAGRLACYESTLAASDSTQIMAFNNSPHIWRNAARRFYRKSEHLPNRYAWMRAMDNRYIFTKNSPVVYTRATSMDDAEEIHRTARLAAIEQMPSANGTSSYVYTWVDHGYGSRRECAAVPADYECEPVDN